MFKSKWPYSVVNPFVYGTVPYLNMLSWLQENVGNLGQEYSWKHNDIIMFATKEDAIFFAITWNALTIVQKHDGYDWDNQQ